MSHLVEAAIQAIAAFVLHALWQAPLLAVAAALAMRIGRPQPKLAHVLWTATLLLCVLMPLGATVMARRAAAFEARQSAHVSITFLSADAAGTLPEMHRAPLWQSVLNRHFSRRYGVTPFAFTLPARAAGIIAAFYLCIALCLAIHLTLAWRRSRLLVRSSTPLPYNSTAAQVMLQQSRELGVPTPSMRVSDALAGPALAGALQPTLLLPACVAHMSAAEIEAVVAHELAHLRRHDPPIHLACSFLLVLVGFHPAALWIAKRVRQTREMACDAEAAQHIGSSPLYARALLQVAERTGAGDARMAGLGLFQGGLGLFTTGLGLVTNGLERTGGAMEERMQMLLKRNDSGSTTARAMRWSACIAAFGVALLSASMVQVRPVLAQQQAMVAPAAQQSSTPEDQQRLLGGEHAQEQLRKAGRDLDVAASKATTSDERNKIATARAVLRTAQQQLAAAGATPDKLDLRVQLDDLKDLKIDPQVRVLIRDLKIDPELKLQLEKQQLDAEKLRAEIEKHRPEFDRIKNEVNSPEFQATIHAQVEEAKKQMAAVRINQADIDRVIRDSEQERKRAMEMLQSGEIQRQIAAANNTIARVELPPLPSPAPSLAPTQQDPDQPIKISPGVASANILNRVVDPIYPDEARRNHTEGAVVLHVIIDKSGHIETMQVASSPDDSLSRSAITAVQQWTWRPYLLNGNPRAIDTTVTVNFHIGA